MDQLPSCFIPGTQIQWAWDSTSLGLFKECPRKYYYRMVRQLAPNSINLNLEFGGIYASSLECYHKSRFANQHDQAVRDAVLLALKLSVNYDPPGETKKTRYNLLRTIIWYLDEFGEADNCKTVIVGGVPAIEQTFMFELPTYPEDYPEHHYTLCGHMDRLVEFMDQYYVQDQKTTGGALGSYYFNQYSPGNQMSLYSVAGKIVFNKPVRGVIVDAAQIMVGFTEFGRGIVDRSEGVLEEWLDDAQYWIDRAHWCAVNDKWPLNDMSCHKYSGCEFRSNVCTKDPSVRESFLKTHFSHHEWNPSEPRK